MVDTKTVLFFFLFSKVLKPLLFCPHLTALAGLLSPSSLPLPLSRATPT